jgi:hypothetical protein
MNTLLEVICIATIAEATALALFVFAVMYVSLAVGG